MYFWSFDMNQFGLQQVEASKGALHQKGMSILLEEYCKFIWKISVVLQQLVYKPGKPFK